LQIHFPDPATPIDETLEGFDRVIRDGKVLEIGCCNFSASETEEAALSAARGGHAPFVSAQVQYNLLNRKAEEELIPTLRRHHMALIPYWPLSGGVLTGKYRRGETPAEGSRMSGQSPEQLARILSDRRLDMVESLEQFARDRDHTLTELALSWLAAQDTVATIIAGSTRPEQIAENVRAVNWELTGDDLAALDALKAEWG
jgi:aryl-alcohol dehydrogenase-like predicted oxidoreductase